MNLLYLNTERIILLKTGERKQRGEIVALARSIGKIGLLVPLTVRKIEHTDRYELLSGIKRFYACRMAHINSVPVYVTDIKPSLARVTAKRGEKQDFFEEAEGIRTAILDTEMSAEEISNASGYSQKTVVAMLRITKMSEIEREMARKNNVPFEILTEIAKHDDILKRTEMLSNIINSRMNTDDALKLLDRKAKRTPKFRDMRIFDNTVNRAVSMLKEAGVKAQIESSRQNTGIEYKIKIEN